jgi:MoaA/NifB/PqqE/SkfB family radical SAM enzyme
LRKLEAAERAAVGLALEPLLRKIKQDPQTQLKRMAGLVRKLGGGVFPEKTLATIAQGAADPENVWTRFALSVVRDTDPAFLTRLVQSLGVGIFNGTKLVRKNRERYGCNIPFQILFDPTSACNLHCKGCWAGEYEKHHSLSLAEMDSIVTQGAALGTRVYMITGGEPLLRKDDLLTIARAHKNCTFLIYTNATRIDRPLVEETKRLGNVVFAVSLEGWAESNDARRGAGAFARSMQAIDLLRESGVLFGISVCYTRENLDVTTSDAFLDFIVEKGARFAFFFHYFPLGENAPTDLLPTPAQRTALYHRLRELRDKKSGKPIFIMDFQNDGEYVGGCIGGGRNYFHVNAAGDIEPCVFVHYSDSNIRRHTLLEALQRPLFRAYHQGQPFNDNHLRPCPLLENPEVLRRMVGETGAVSTDLASTEDVCALCDKCADYAHAWRDAAETLWTQSPHPNPKTQYYRDTKVS